MSVTVKLDAKADSALRAVQEIRDALAAAGAAGKALADIDFGKSGIADLAKDLAQIERNLKDLTKLTHSATGQNARKILGRDPTLADLGNLPSALDRFFPDPAGRARFLSNFGSYVFGGTQFAPPSGPPIPPRPRRGGGAAFQGADAWEILKHSVVASTGFLLAQAGFGSLSSIAGRAIDASKAETGGVDELLRRSGALAETFGELRKQTRAAAEGIHASYIEMARFSAAFAAASGQANGDAVGGARLAAGFAKGFGADPSLFVRGVGQGAFLGMEPGRFAEIVGEAAARGSMTGKIEEVLSTILQFTQTASRYSATDADLRGRVAAYGALFGEANASGSPALRGANGAAALDAVNGAIMTGGGGGLPGQVLVTRALMRAGITDPYKLELQTAGGAFARLPNGETNFSAITGELRREYRGMGEEHLAIATGRVFNLNPQTALALILAGLDRGGGDRLKKLEKLLEPYGGLEKVNPSGLASIFEVAEADHAGLAASRKRIIDRLGTTDPETVNRLNGAGSDAELEKLLVGYYAKNGLEADKQTENTDAINKLTNELTKIGDPLVQGVNRLTDGILGMVDRMEPVFDYFTRQFSDAHAGDFSEPTRTERYGSGRMVFARTVPADHKGDVLGRVTHQESADGANPNLFGFIDSTWVSDVRALGSQDEEVGQKIAGMKDWQIVALKNNAALQKRVAEYHYKGVLSYMKARKLPLSDLGVYMLWNFGNEGGERFSRAPGSAKLQDTMSADAYAAVSKLHVGQGLVTVDDYKRFYASRGFSDKEFHDATPGLSDTGARITVSAGAPVQVVIKDERGKNLGHATVPIETHTTAVPYGVHP